MPLTVTGSTQDVGHGHGHGQAAPAGRRVRVLLAALLVPCALAALVGLVVLHPTGGSTPAAGTALLQPVRGQVTAVEATDCSPGDGQGRCAALVVAMTDGPRAGRDLVQLVPIEPGTPRFTVGDPVVLGWSGGNPDDPGSYQVVDFQRGGSLAWLAALFAAAVLVLGRWRGLAALAALAVSFGVLLLFVLPAILDGRSPLAVAVVGAGVIMFAVLYLTHGLSARTSTAVLGTLVSLALIGLLGAVFSAACPADRAGRPDHGARGLARHRRRRPRAGPGRHGHRSARGARRRHGHPDQRGVGASPRQPAAACPGAVTGPPCGSDATTSPRR